MAKDQDLDFASTQEERVNQEIESLLSKFMKNVSELAEHIFFSQSPHLQHQNLSSRILLQPFNASLDDSSTLQFEESQNIHLFDLIPTLTKFLLISLAIFYLSKLVPILNTLLRILLSWVIFVCVSPLLIAMFLPILSFRLGLHIYLKYKYKGEVFLAQPLDACWAFEKFASSSTCIGLYVIEGEWSMEKILRRCDAIMKLQFVEKKGTKPVQMFERMRCLLLNKVGFTCWERDAHFNISDHVKVIRENYSASPNNNQRLKDPTQVKWNEEKLHAELAGLQDVPFLREKSPWEILVVPNYTSVSSPKPHYCIVFRYNHCLMDGVSAGNALHSAIADKPFKLTVDPLDPLRITKFQLMSAHILALFTIPYTIIKNLCLFESSRFHSFGRNLKGGKMITWSRPLNIEILKEIKNASKTSIFAVLISSLGGAMRKLFQKYGDSVPDVITAAPPIAIIPYPDRRPRNRFSIVLFPIKIGLDNIRDRLRAADKSSRDLASSTEILANYYVMMMLGLLPMPLLKIFGPLAHATLTLSNIPGPAEEVYIFEGDKLTDIGAWIPIKNSIGIGVALFSYAGRIRITLIADGASLPCKSDADFLIGEFENEIRDMAKNIGLDDTKLFF